MLYDSALLSVCTVHTNVHQKILGMHHYAVPLLRGGTRGQCPPLRTACAPPISVYSEYYFGASRNYKTMGVVYFPAASPSVVMCQVCFKICCNLFQNRVCYYVTICHKPHQRSVILSDSQVCYKLSISAALVNCFILFFSC